MASSSSASATPISVPEDLLGELREPLTDSSLEARLAHMSAIAGRGDWLERSRAWFTTENTEAVRSYLKELGLKFSKCNPHKDNDPEFTGGREEETARNKNYLRRMLRGLRDANPGLKLNSPVPGPSTGPREHEVFATPLHVRGPSSAPGSQDGGSVSSSGARSKGKGKVSAQREAVNRFFDQVGHSDSDLSDAEDGSISEELSDEESEMSAPPTLDRSDFKRAQYPVHIAKYNGRQAIGPRMTFDIKRDYQSFTSYGEAQTWKSNTRKREFMTLCRMVDVGIAQLGIKEYVKLYMNEVIIRRMAALMRAEADDGRWTIAKYYEELGHGGSAYVPVSEHHRANKLAKQIAAAALLATRGEKDE